MTGHATDRQGRFWERLYRRGERLEQQFPWRPHRAEKLDAYAKNHPFTGSVLQGLMFAVLFFPFLAVGWLFTRMPFALVVGIGIASGVFFSGCMFGYNHYVKKHGEPWANEV